MADPTALSAPAHLTTPGSRWLQPVLTGLLILFCLAMAGRGLGNPYSYWSDEIWSVGASSTGWGGLMRDWLIPKTHPPPNRYGSSAGTG